MYKGQGMRKILITMDDINYKGGAHFATFRIANFLSENNSVVIYSPVVVHYNTTLELNKSITITNEKSYMGYDVVIVPFENSIFREEVSRLDNCMKIQWIHIEYEKWHGVSGIDKNKEKEIFSRFDKVVFVSMHNLKSFVKFFPELEKKCFVIYNFLDEDNIRMKSVLKIDDEIMKKTLPEELNIVLVGRLEPQKEYHRMIDVVKVLNDENLKINWYVLGQGYEYDGLKQRCKKYRINNVHFLGYRQNPYPFVTQADVFALLSGYEGLALVIAESLVCGTPVLSTESGGVREVLSEKEGWIIDNEFHAIVDAIREIYQDRSILDKKRQAIKEYHYDNKRIEKDIRILLQDDNLGENRNIMNFENEKNKEQKLIKNPEISIIVPVYNMELYLAECLDSLVNQTFRDLEIIVVNDGSTDHSLEIMNDYIYRYPDKIRGFTIENSGLGEARNYGIKRACGRFLGFVDSDDAVRLDMFEILYRSAVQNSADCILCDYIATWESGKSEYVTSVPVEQADRFDIIRYSAKYGVVNACTKLIDKKLFDHILFPKGFYEDLATVPIILSYANKISYVREGLYYYRQRMGSITSIKSNDSRLFDCYSAWDRIYENANSLMKKEISFAIYWSMNFFCTNFLDDFTLYSKRYYEERKEWFVNNEYIKNAISNDEMQDFETTPEIPKIIHYCWFGHNKKSDLINKCIESWKKYAKGFEIIEWNEDNCNIHENAYVDKAYKEKKWAFVSDYFRLKALYEMGGVYMDTDMELMRPLEPYLCHNAFFAFETPIFVHAGIMGAIPHHELVYKIMKSYEKDEFCVEKSNIPKTIPMRITEILSRETNLVKNGKSQILDGDIKIFSANLMTLNFSDGKCIANHHYDGNWMDLDYKKSAYNFRYEVLKHYFTWDLLEELRVSKEEIKCLKEQLKLGTVHVENLQLDLYEDLYEELVSSTCWKITKPLRKMMDCLRGEKCTEIVDGGDYDYEQLYNQTITSTSWKITKPLRIVKDGLCGEKEE